MPNEQQCISQIINKKLMSSVNAYQIDSPLRLQSKTQIPTISRGELKKIQQDVVVAKNRIATLRQQLQKQKDLIKKHKQLTQDVIAKKVAVNQIINLKNKDNSSDNARIQYLRKRNLSMRLQHQKSLQNIQKAIYLVKLDDAREVKNISQQHKRKLRQYEDQSYSRKKQKKKQLKEQSQKAKQRYMQYWRQKLMSIYTEQAQSAQQILKNKQEKSKQLKQLEEQQMKLLEEINMFHTKHVQSKKQYVAALSLPVKDVAEALMGNSIKLQNQESKDIKLNRNSLSLGQIEGKSAEKNKINYLRQRLQQSQSQSLPNFGPKIKVPNTNVNQAKLKIILQQLKKIDKRKQRYEETDIKEGN